MVIARPVKGVFRTIKNRINWILFVIFFGLPFIVIDGRPLLQLDIAARKFHVFGLTIWPQEMYYLHLILLAAGITLFISTALWGRIWCAYACPQTIFIEFYNLVGRFFGGKKFGKKTAGTGLYIRVWIGWIILSIIVGFVFVSYFKGPYNMINEIVNGQIIKPSGRIATWVLFGSGATLFSILAFGWFRENACKYVCPYGRFQTALLDKHSPIVHYDEGRGEPRRQKGQKNHDGDCTACNMCLLVCPTGIDIREGLQVGCIRCGLCVDACTIEMGRDEKKTLIDLRTVEQTTNPEAHRPYVRPRTIVYGSLLSLVVIVFSLLLIFRVPMYTNVTRNRTVQSTFITGIGYQNVYELNVGNMSHQPLDIVVSLENNDENFVIANAQPEYTIDASNMKKLQLIVRYNSEKPVKLDNQRIKFKIQNKNKPTQMRVEKSIFSFASI